MPRPASRSSSTPTTAAFAALGRGTALLDGLARAGVDTLELATDDALFDAILRFSDLRRQRSRLAAGGGVAGHLTALQAAS